MVKYEQIMHSRLLFWLILSSIWLNNELKRTLKQNIPLDVNMYMMEPLISYEMLGFCNVF